MLCWHVDSLIYNHVERYGSQQICRQGNTLQARATPTARALARRAECRPARSSNRHVNYVESESSDDEIGGGLQRAVRVIGLLFTVADPRYVGKDTAEAGSVVLNVDEVRKTLRDEENSERQNRTVRLTTSQMGGPIHAEEDEIVSGKDIEKNRSTKRCIAPMISSFTRDRWNEVARARNRE